MPFETLSELLEFLANVEAKPDSGNKRTSFLEFINWFTPPPRPVEGGTVFVLPKDADKENSTEPEKCCDDPNCTMNKAPEAVTLLDLIKDVKAIIEATGDTFDGVEKRMRMFADKHNMLVRDFHELKNKVQALITVVKSQEKEIKRIREETPNVSD